MNLVVCRQILTCLLLAAMVLTGRFAPCDCVSQPPRTTCPDHDHRHPANSADHEHECPCPTCHQHVCSHGVFTVETVVVDTAAKDPGAILLIPHPVEALTGPVVEIFTPPKIG